MPAAALQKIRQKYPEYADLSDQELARRVLAKYPQYSDLVGEYIAPRRSPQGGTINLLTPQGRQAATERVKYLFTPSGPAMDPTGTQLSPVDRAVQQVALGFAAGAGQTPVTIGGALSFARGRLGQAITRRVAKPSVVPTGVVQPADVLGQRVAQLPRAPGGGVILQKPPRANIPPAPTKPVPSPIAQDVLKEPIHRRITTAAGDLFEQAGIQRDPDLRISDQITQLLESERLSVQGLAGTLQRHNLSITEFANEVFRPSIKDAARRLQALSALQRRVNQIMAGAPEEAGKLREFARQVDELAAAKSLWKSPVQIWRTLLVSQPATAARNFVVSVGRLGIDTIEQGLNAGLQRVTGRKVTASPMEPFRALLNIFYQPRVTRGQTEVILQKLPAEWDRMFGSFMSDIAARTRSSGVRLGVKDAILQKAEDGVAITGVFNRGQEFLVRRAVFQASLWQRLRTRGADLLDVIAKNEIDAVTEADIAASVSKALELTFARRAEGEVGRAFVRLINGLGPLAAPVIPFPRFMVEALRFYYEFSPAGLLKLLNPVERAAVAAGNFSTISRSIIGTGLLGTAYGFRKSEYAGERWYEGQAPDGRTVDLRAFNPFAPYLFVADLAVRNERGTLYQLDTKDIATALVGVNVRGGSGLYIMDQVIDQFTGEGRGQKALTKLGRVAGEVASGLLTPLQAISDVLGQFDPQQRVIREKGEEPFLGPIKARIPEISKTLPEKESATRAGPIMREAPLARQITGVSLGQKKNPAEKELDRLQFKYSEITRPEGDSKADRLIAKHMGPLVERLVGQLVTSPAYGRLSDNAKAELLRRYLTNIRAMARQQAQAEDPRLFARLMLERRPIRERRLLQETVPGR